MDQSELNAIAQKWLESLLHPPESQESPSTLAVQSGAQELPDVLGKLRYLLRVNENLKPSLRSGGTHLVVLARSLAAYLAAALDAADLEKASRSLNQHTTKALMTIFRLTGKKLTPFYHDDRKEGITRAAQMALYTKYSQYALKGAAVFHENPPVFYISESGFANDCNNLCGTLGITLSSCRQVPCSAESSFNAMDVAALESQVEEDLKEGRMPVMVIAYAGTPLAGHVEDMAGIRTVCNKHKIWMHVQGHALSSLCFQSTDKEVLQCREADSMTLYPGTWFGLLSSPILTLHRTPYIIETELMENSSEFPPSDLELVEGSIPIPRTFWNGMLPGGGVAKLLPLSLWLCIQYLGTSTLVETVSYCHNLTQHMIEKLDEVPGIRRFHVPGNHQSYTVLFKYFGGGEIDFVSRVTSSPNGGTSAPASPPPSSPSPSSPPTSASETQSPGESTDAVSEEDGAKHGGSKVMVEELAPATSNVANAMIARDLQVLFPKVGISPLKLPEYGVSFRFDPINAFPEHSTSLEDVTKFVEALKQRLQSIHMTALARRLIEEELKGQPNLRCLEFPSFFGSGFIQYVPTDWAEKTELTLEEVSTLNALNIELSNILTEKNPSFSPFQHGNFSCIMIKELQADVNLQDFLDLLLSETAAFEDHKKFLEGMSEKIKKGIETAESDLTKEKQQREQEEGYLRYVPIVGSVLNWFSPPTPTTPQGRTFNLSSGKVADTGATYKYKMQVTAGEVEKEGGDKEEEQLSGEYSGVDVSLSEQAGSQEVAESQEEAKSVGTGESSQDNAESVPSQQSQEVPAGEAEVKEHSQEEAA